MQPVPYGSFAPRPPEGPVDLRELVPGEGPIELDVGFGRGRSLLERAAAHPELRVIGIEVKAKWAHKVAERLHVRGIANARAFFADARDLLPRAHPDACLARVFLHFPDPWWKKRHGKRRVLSHDLLDQLARLLAPGGELFVQTDVEERANEYAELFASHRAFAPVRSAFAVEDNPFGARSNREARAESDGLPVYRLLARRV